MVPLLYFIFIIFFIASSNYKKKYIQKFRTKESKSNLISIIIPARNEESNINDILVSTLNQNYPKENFEVIIVNDRSTDKTEEIANSFKAQYDNLRVVTIKENISGLSGKQNALDVGIKESSCDIILITDADCVIKQNWVKSVNRIFQNNRIGLVVGKTKILYNSINVSFIEKIQIIADRLLMEIAQVPIMFGFYTSGMGNNLAFKKEYYLELGGYDGLGDSILDDEILVRGFARKGYKIAAMFNDNGVVSTKPMKNWDSLIKQHKRWVAGSLNIFTPSGLWTFAYYFVNLYTLFLFFRLDFFVIFKFVGDFMLFVKLNRTEDKKILNNIEEILFPIFGTVYITLIISYAIIRPKSTWKDQTFKASKMSKGKK